MANGKIHYWDHEIPKCQRVCDKCGHYYNFTLCGKELYDIPTWRTEYPSTKLYPDVTHNYSYDFPPPISGITCKNCIKQLKKLGRI